MSWEMTAHAGHRRAWGLLLLRVALTVTLVQLAQAAGPACPPWAWWLLCVLAGGLLPGLLSCPCAALSLLWLALLTPAASAVAAWPPAALAAAALAGAVMLLGAGRWSVDRRLFGRQLVFESDDTFG